MDQVRLSPRYFAQICYHRIFRILCFFRQGLPKVAEWLIWDVWLD